MSNNVLEAAQAIIDAREKATPGVWIVQTLPMASIDAMVDEFRRWIIEAKSNHGPHPMICVVAGDKGISFSGGSTNATPNNDFIALSANHAAAVAQALIELVEYIRDDADEDCVYNDGCPQFANSRHGTCRPCKAKRELARIMGKEDNKC